MMLVVVDTEEEFDWDKPFSRDARSTENMREQHKAQAILDRHGAKPLYVIDHPVATDPWATGWLRETLQDDRAEVGSHLHTWVTPPYSEAVSSKNSYGCNLDPALEREKIQVLTDSVAENVGVMPVHFRAGRYGLGFGTLRTLRDLGYRTELSIAPHSNFARDGGPSFYGWSNEPYWHGTAGRIARYPRHDRVFGSCEGARPSRCTASR